MMIRFISGFPGGLEGAVPAPAAGATVVCGINGFVFSAPAGGMTSVSPLVTGACSEANGNGLPESPLAGEEFMSGVAAGVIVPGNDGGISVSGAPDGSEGTALGISGGVIPQLGLGDGGGGTSTPVASVASGSGDTGGMDPSIMVTLEASFGAGGLGGVIGSLLIGGF